MTEIASPPRRILRRPVVLDRLGVCSAQLDRLVKNEGFPPAIKITARYTGWLEHEVDAWIDARAEASRAPDGPKPKPFGRHAKQATSRPGANV